jgi:hypothetical protein
MLIWAAPKMLRQQIADVKANLTSPTGKFGVDLAIPQVGNYTCRPSRCRS